MALVIVLSFLVLITALVIAFFTSVTTEFAGSKTYATGVATKQLADSTVSTVMGLVKDASSQGGKAWASQPGMIRVYDNQGKPFKYYKLYSSDKLILDSTGIGSFDFSNEVPTDWDRTPSLYTDLNAPVMAPVPGDPNTQKPIFPIVDPRAVDNGVEGFSYAKALNGTSIDGVVDAGGDIRRVPMPVRWIYVLQDGALSSPTTGDASGARWDTAAGNIPSASNPIVGRIAFWTDDDTAKVNINTASEGTYWDTPISTTSPSASDTQESTLSPLGTGDYQLGAYQPAQKEFQRYPGHPATTSLSPIFSKLLTGGGASMRADLVKALTDITPRVTDSRTASADSAASSMGGTQSAAPVSSPPPGAPLPGIKVDSDRLYASVDELTFKPTRTEQSPTTSAADFRDAVEKSRFFLTANSRAPEENLFGKPRVAIWPITKPKGSIDSADQSKMTTFDKLIARAATVSGTNSASTTAKGYYFTRANPKSQTEDWGLRNKGVYTYLMNLTGQDIPGFGGNFAQKYSASSGGALERDQILTEIFDYIRCTNLVDSSEGESKAYTDPAQTTEYSTNRGWVVPIKPTGVGAGTRGFGRIPTISELALVCIGLQPDKDGKVNGVPVPAGSMMIEANLVPELFCPMAGFSAISENIRIKFKTITLGIGTVANAFGPGPYSEIKSTNTDTGRISDGDNGVLKTGGPMGIGTLTEPPSSGSIATPDDSVYPSAEVLVPTAGGKFTIKGGTVTADIISPANSTNVVQSFTFNFQTEDVTLPAFVDPTQKIPGSGRKRTYGEYAVGGTGSKIKGNRLNVKYHEGMILPEDAVRSVSATGGPGKGIQGDYRLIAARQDVDQISGQNIFNQPDPYPPARQYHGIQGSYRTGRGDIYRFPGFEYGKLVKDVSYVKNANRAMVPDVPLWRAMPKKEQINGVENSLGQPGDWDNGPALVFDGAFLNKADEGSPSYAVNWLWYTSMQQTTTFFSPNHQVPSPVVFGSLPTGVLAGKPWQTLHFRPKNLVPNSAGTIYSHPGGADYSKNVPPDHLLLDLFWMPVVEPYAISEPFSTAGKINLNYQIAPFTYIKRDTGMRAVLKSVMITAMNPNDPGAYIWPDGNNSFSQTYKWTDSLPWSLSRRAINLDETLKQFETRFTRKTHTRDTPNFFVSPSEICDVYLIPKVDGITADNVNTDFWKKNVLTGDNSLERPYSHIYPRVTTKSNTYTVHVRVQSLKKVPSDPAQATWKENRDQVTGEFRGSFVIERYLDPEVAGFYKNGDESQPAAETDADAILAPYRFRVVSSKQFGR